jgi:hypothetical protein
MVSIVPSDCFTTKGLRLAGTAKTETTNTSNTINENIFFIETV